MKDMRVVFMGTPEFAVPSLQVLVENEINVVGVITAPDKPKGRGKQIGISAVKESAMALGLNILQPTNLKNEAFLEELRSLKADLQIVVAFRMLPEVVWNMPINGTFNLHGSLLPQYRGAAPINWAIMNGEKETGITTFFLKHAIDTGDILFQEKEPIHPSDNVGSLYARLMAKGAQLVLRTTEAIINNNYSTQDQTIDEPLKNAPKLTRESCQIDWNQSVEKVINHIRGLSPYPAAWTTFKDKNLKVYAASISESKSSLPIGSIDISNGSNMLVKTATHTLSLDEVQLEGKRKMKTSDLLRGLKID